MVLAWLHYNLEVKTSYWRFESFVNHVITSVSLVAGYSFFGEGYNLTNFSIVQLYKIISRAVHAWPPIYTPKFVLTLIVLCFLKRSKLSMLKVYRKR